MRETTGPVVHPQHLWGWTRVDLSTHPSVRPLYEGAPDMGWAPDERLCLYLNDTDRAVILVRLEADGEYRTVIRRDLTSDERLMGGAANEQLLGPASINRLIARLIAHDTRRGFDVIDATLGANERLHAAHDAAFTELIREDIADRLWFALGRSYMPGMDIRPRMARR